MNEQSNYCTKLLTGFGEIAYGNQYSMGNRVYDSNAVAMAVCASPVGNLGGQTYLYLVVKIRKVNGTQVH